MTFFSFLKRESPCLDVSLFFNFHDVHVHKLKRFISLHFRCQVSHIFSNNLNMLALPSSSYPRSSCSASETYQFSTHYQYKLIQYISHNKVKELVAPAKTYLMSKKGQLSSKEEQWKIKEEQKWAKEKQRKELTVSKVEQKNKSEAFLLWATQINMHKL